MRKTILILALFAATPAVAQQAPPQPKPETERQAGLNRYQQACQHQLQRTGQAPRTKPLGEMRPGRFERAVLRTVNGCPVPVYVRHYPERREER